MEKEKNVVLNYIKHKLNDVDFVVKSYEDNGKTIFVEIDVEDEGELSIAVNRRKDGYRIISMG